MKLISILCKSFFIFLFMGFIGLMSSCDMLGGLGIGSSAQYSLIPTEGLSTEHIPSEEFFYVNIKEAYYYGEEFNALDAIIYAMDNGPGTDCKISVNEDSTEDLYCILDVMEGDLFFHSLVLEYNIPAGMCDYSGFIVPFHYNQEVGIGPETVWKCKEPKSVSDDGTVETEDTFCRVPCKSVSCVVTNIEDTCNTKENCEKETNNCGKGSGGNDIPGIWNKNTEVCLFISTACTTEADCIKQESNTCGGPGTWFNLGTDCPKDVQELCQSTDYPYDQSNKDNKENCCFGDYTIANGSSYNDKETNWGGDFQKCIGGPGRFAWEGSDGRDAYNKKGKPLRVITNTKKEGLKETYELDAIINIYDGHFSDNKIPSFITANYWEDAEDKDFNSSKSDLKIYSHDSTDPKDEIPEGNPYFVWSCLDKAQEIKHRIILLIREWNTQKEYNKFKETSGSSGDPDIVGDEGDHCDYYTPDEKVLFKQDSSCNDYIDLDDWESEGARYPEVIYTDSTD